MRKSRAIQNVKPCVFLTYKSKTVAVLVSKRITYIYFLVPVGLKDYRLVCIWTETTTHGIFVCIHFLVTTRGEFKAFKRCLGGLGCWGQWGFIKCPLGSGSSLFSQVYRALVVKCLRLNSEESVRDKIMGLGV